MPDIHCTFGAARRIGRLSLAALALGLCAWAAQADELLDRARQLLDAKKPADAYAALIAEAPQRAGDPDFDLLLGMAALDAGHPTQSVFALERVLAVEPDNARARAELARAYFQMNENEAAKQEFTTVRGQTLPPDLTKAVDSYLSAIDARFESQRTRIDVYLEGAAGYDSNVNGATDQSQIAIPALGNLVFTLDNSGREQDSGFFELNAGVNYSTPFLGRQDLRVFGAMNIDERIPASARDFRTRFADGQAGLNYIVDDRDALLVSAQGQRFYIGGAPNRDQLGGSVQWLHSWDERTQFSAFGQYAAQRFPDQAVRNVDQFSGGLGVVHAFAGEGQPILYASAFGGTDEERSSLRDDIGRTFAGLRVGGQYSLDAKKTLIGSVSYQHSRYGAPDPLFLDTRTDDFVMVRAAFNYALAKHWSVRPELQYSNNNSTLVINDFGRWQAFVTVRNDF